MILTVAVFLSALGFAAWILGTLFNYYGVATIGAVIVVGVGAMVTTNGLEYQTGEVQTEVTNETTEVDYTYQSLDAPNHFNLGALVMLLGGAMFLQALNESSGGG